MPRGHIRQLHSPHVERRILAATIVTFVLSALTLTLPYFATANDENDKAKNDSANKQPLKGLPTTDLSENEAVVHALNRLGYGPRPGDIHRVKQMGLAKWIDQQLHPESLDDSALDARLQRFPTLHMSAGQLLDEFPRPQIAARREGVSVEEYRKEQQEKQQKQQQNLQNQQAMDLVAAVAEAQVGDAAAPGKMDSQGDSGGDADMSVLGRKNGKGGKDSGLLPNRLMNFQDNHTPQRIVTELAMAKMDRAIYSERQLDEQMVDLWFNHFNVFAGKGLDRWMLTSFEQDAIRPHAMGKFRDLLEATAKSPAMLFFLDNWQSVDPEAWARLQQEQGDRRAFRGRFGGPFGMPRFPAGGQNPGQANNKKLERGLNENYGRELMELHTLGVDGGYTQDDVIAVARCFTGWSIRMPQRDPQFYFEERLHDNKPKIVLGHKINAGGMKDGEEVLDLLARDPHTARHLSLEIARHFVSDNPPEALVNRMTQTYLSTGGDIRAVLHTMIYSPEFWSRETYRAKIKTPFELVASAARAVNADAEVPFLLVQWTARIGEPLYGCQPPTGYSDKADAWVNTGALLNRMNYALALGNGRLPGVRVDTAELLAKSSTQPAEVLDRAIAVLLSGEVSPQTRETLEKQLNDPQVLQARLDDPVTHINDGMIAGLVLGAPEFQRR